MVVSVFLGAIGSQGHLQATPAQVEKAHELLAKVEMDGYVERMFQRLSCGQKRRLLLTLALIHEPRALILYESANRLDMGASLQMLTLQRRRGSH